NAGCVGRTLHVLFEKAGRLPGQLVGRSPYLQPVQVMAPAALVGEVVAVTITRAGANSLFGELASPAHVAAPALASVETCGIAPTRIRQRRAGPDACHSR